MRVLGIDYGRKRMGLALSDATGLLARPWKTIASEGGVRQAAAEIAREIAALRAHEDGLGAVVIGLPRRLSGEPNEQTAAVEALVRELRRSTDLPLVLQDERLTSREAEARLAAGEKDWRRRKPLVDATAAAIILQDYLDGRPGASAVEERDC